MVTVSARFYLSAVVSLLSLVLLATPVSAQQAVVTVAPLDELLSALRHTLRATGRAEQVKSVDDVIKAFDDLRGIDPRRPAGVFLSLADPAEAIRAVAGAGGVTAAVDKSRVVVALPVGQRSLLLELLRKLGVDFTQTTEDVFPAKLATGQKVTFRFANGYLLGATDAAELKTLPDLRVLSDPAVRGKLLQLTVRMDTLSKDTRKTSATAASELLKHFLAVDPKASAAEKAIRGLSARLLSEAGEAVLGQGGRMTLSLRLDARTDQLGLELVLTPNADGKDLQAVCEALKPASGLAGPPLPDSAAHVGVRLSLPNAISDTVYQLFNESVLASLGPNPDPDASDYANRLVAELANSFHDRTLDLGVSLRGPGTDGLFTVAGALRVRDGQKLDTLFRDMFIAREGTVSYDVKIEAGQHDRVYLHYLRRKPDQLAERLDKFFGTPEVWLAFREDALVFTLGQDGKNLIRRKLDSLAKPMPPTPPTHAELALKRFAPFLDEPGKRWSAAAKRLPIDNRDRIRLTLFGGRELRLKLDIHVTVFQLAAEAEK